MPRICKFPTNINQQAAAKNLTIESDSQGRYRVVDRLSRAYVDTFDTQAEAKAFLSKTSPAALEDLDGALPFPAESTASAITNPRIQDQPTPFMENVDNKLRSIYQHFEMGGGKILTPAKKMMQALETKGVDKPWSKIYEPLDRGSRKVNVNMAAKQEAFDGKSFHDSFNTLEKMSVSLDAEQSRLAVLHGEAYTKQELERPGVLTADGMTTEEINAANSLAAMGVGEDIPRLVRQNAILDGFLVNRENALAKLPSIEAEIRTGHAPPELQGFVDRIREAAGEADNLTNLIKSLGLSDNEKSGLLLVRALMTNTDENAPRLLPIFRHATAPILEDGFKDGRAQFIVQRKMNPVAVATSNFRQKILRTAYARTDYSADQVIGAQLPIFRQFADVGIFPFSSKQNSNIPPYVLKLFDALPEGTEMLNRRVLSGHINPHELDPVVTSFKHVRNVLMKESVDPHIPEALKTIQRIVRNHPEEWGIDNALMNYVHEIEGQQVGKYDQLNRWIQNTLSNFGITVDDRFANHLVNLLSRLASTASIPFRPALVMRNSLQSLFMTAPITGIKDWWAAAKIASGWKDGAFDSELLAGARERAIKSGALEPNVTPIYEPREILGAGRETLLGRILPPQLAKARLTFREMTDWGFEIYRRPDDWGRVLANESMRIRVGRAVEQWVRSPQDEAALEHIAIISKAKTFDETIEAQFKDFIRNGQFEEAKDLLGKELADKTHFLYPHANHPAGWGGIGGRLFGQFGTFPIQYANYVMENLTRGTMKDRAEWLAMHGAMNVGIVGAGAVAGLDLTSWAVAPSLRYSGGPYAGITMNLAGMLGGSPSERSLARRNLMMQFPTFSNPQFPQSIFVPGSYFIADLKDALINSESAGQSIENALGFKILQPGRENRVQKAFSHWF